MKQCIIIFVCLLCLASCYPHKERVKGYVYDVGIVPIRGGNKRAALYWFSYSDSIYTGTLTYSKISKWHYLAGDSIWITFPDGNPQKSRPDGIFFRLRNKELVIPAVNDSNRIATYRSIAEKPIFYISDIAENNKEKMREYVNSKKIEEKIHTVGVDIIVSKSGKIETVKLLRTSNNNELDSFVVKTLLSLPAGKPGLNKEGEPERVGLLMEFDFR